MHVVQHPVRQQRRRMYSPIERGVVSNVGVGYAGNRYVYTGLGEVDGLFNIGKMFTRMFTFTPSSFKIKNIAGAVGSAVTAFGTFGIAPVAAELLGPSGLKVTKGTLTGAHSKIMPYVGYAAAAATAVVGGAAAFGAFSSVAGATGAGLTTVGGTAVGTASSGSATIGAALGTGVSTSGGFLSTVGSVFSGIGSVIGTGLKALTAVLPVMSQVMGGGGGGQQQQQQGGMTQAEYDAQQQAAAEEGARQQREYDAQVRAQQAQMYQPGMMPVSYDMSQPPSMNTSYGDLRTPYTAITEDGQTVQVDPNTGQIISSAISTPMLIGGGAIILLLGWYVMSGSKESN